MATIGAILEVFDLLWDVGVAKGPDPIDEDGVQRMSKVWNMLLKDVSDDELTAAVANYLRDGKVCQWWPQPGVLISRVPSRQTAVIRDYGEAWAMVLDYVRSDWRPHRIHRTQADGSFGPDPVVYPWQDGTPRAVAIDRAVASLGGLQAIADVGDSFRSTDSLPGLRKAFRDTYESSREKQGHGQTLTAISDKGQTDYSRLEVLAKKIGKASD